MKASVLVVQSASFLMKRECPDREVNKVICISDRKACSVLSTAHGEIEIRSTSSLRTLVEGEISRRHDPLRQPSTSFTFEVAVVPLSAEVNTEVLTALLKIINEGRFDLRLQRMQWRSMSA